MPIYISLIFISFVSSILSLTVKENRPYFRYFPFLLGVTFIVEYYGWYLGNKGQRNVAIYNLYSVYEFAFYMFFLRMLIGAFYKGKLILITILVYLALTLLNIFLIQGINTFHTYTYILGDLIIVTLCIIYFNYFVRFTKSKNLFREPVFWIVTGLLFSYAFSLPLFGISNFATSVPARYLHVLEFAINFMNIMLYLLFTIGFICKINILKLLS
jgi:hypothetical protein